MKTRPAHFLPGSLITPSTRMVGAVGGAGETGSVELGQVPGDTGSPEYQAQFC